MDETQEILSSLEELTEAVQTLRKERNGLAARVQELEEVRARARLLIAALGLQLMRTRGALVLEEIVAEAQNERSEVTLKTSS